MRSLQRDLIEILECTETTDGYGSTIPGEWSVVASGYGSVQPYVSIENNEDRQTLNRYSRLISDDPRLFEISYKNRVRFQGELWECDGHPFMWHRNGKIHHVEQNIQRVEG